MDMNLLSSIFKMVSIVVLPFWLLMILIPRSRFTRRAMKTYWAALIPAIFYSILVLPQLPSLFGVLANPDLKEIMSLLGTPMGATAAWIHFLALDMFLARYIWKAWLQSPVPSLVVGIVIFVTLMFAPLGLLLYFVIDKVGGRRWEKDLGSKAGTHQPAI